MNWEILVQELEELEALPLSFSKMNTLFSCPLCYQRQYIEKSEKGIPLIKEPAVVGKLIHSIFENCITRGVTFGFEDDVVEFNRVWAAISKQTPLTMKEYDMAIEQKVHARAIYSRMVELIKKHHLVSIPELQVICTKDLRVVRNAKWPKRLLFGYIDYFGISKNGTRALIIDYKTHKKTEDNALSVDIQTRVYGFLIMLMYPTVTTLKIGAAYVPDELVEAPVVFTRDKVHKYEQYVFELLTKFKDSLITAKASGFAPTEGKRCDWCNYHTICPMMIEKVAKKEARKKKKESSTKGR